MDTTKAPVELLGVEGAQHYGAFTTVDERDHSLAAYTPIAAASQPDSYYPNLDGIPHWFQSKLGACVGHAAGKSEQVCKYHENPTAPIVPISARFLYAYSKATDGYPNEEGTVPRNVASIMKNVGCATEATCVNDTSLDHNTYTYGGTIANLPVAALAEAGKIKIGGYAFAPITEAGIKAAIQFAGENKGGVFMLSQIDKAWWTSPDNRVSWDAADILPLRAPIDAATLGGHETYPYAFDKVNGRTVIHLFNSWGESWGDKGNGWFYLDQWLPHIVEVITTFDLPDNYVAPTWSYTFTRALKQGMSGADVVALQHALKIDGEFPANTPLTGYFGAVTLAAVNAFQNKYAADILLPNGLTAPTGFVGTSTLKKLNALFAMK